MPTEPDELLAVTIYHCYKDDIISTYWYTADPSNCDTDCPAMDSNSQFDIRNLPNCGLDVDNPENHGVIIRGAITERLRQVFEPVNFNLGEKWDPHDWVA